MLTRETVLEQIKAMPETFSIDELMEKLLFIYNVETGLEQSKKNQVTPHKEIKEKYKKWLQ
ncbi:MAG: hypothetical protein EPO28_02350 [Saprospiraceae bacterium]|nr:MAG: hypothetical protein EPO28_02350 [Saprospiraceae bacterium]